MRLVPVLAIVGVLGWAQPLAAQGERAVATAQTWALDSLRSGICIQFLVSPVAAAASREFRGAELAPAGGSESLHPALRRALAENTELASWIPSSFCLYQFGAVRAAGRTIIDKKRQPQAIALWTMAGPAATPLLVLVNNSRMTDAVRRAGVRVTGMKTVFGKVPEGTDERYEVRYDGSTLTWDGRVVGDSMAPPSLRASGIAPGRNGVTWHITSDIRPGGARNVAGALRVEGKGDLARMLSASPIRYVGPLVWGGGGEMKFTP